MSEYIVTKDDDVIAKARAYTVGMAGELNLLQGEGSDEISFTTPFTAPFERYSLTLAPGQWDCVFWDEHEEVED